MQMNNRSFTLLEMLIVIVIIGILAGAAIPVYLNSREKAYSAEAWVNLSALAKGLKQYMFEYNNAWTTNISALEVDDPGTNPNAKFTYAIWGTAAQGGPYAMSKANPSIGYQIQCQNGGTATETWVRYQTRDNWASAQQLP